MMNPLPSLPFTFATDFILREWQSSKKGMKTLRFHLHKKSMLFRYVLRVYKKSYTFFTFFRGSSLSDLMVLNLRSYPMVKKVKGKESKGFWKKGGR
jgi:hypothetical protein